MFPSLKKYRILLKRCYFCINSMSFKQPSMNYKGDISASCNGKPSIQTNSPTEKQLENLNVFLLFYTILFFLQIQKDPKGRASLL